MMIKTMALWVWIARGWEQRGTYPTFKAARRARENMEVPRQYGIIQPDNHVPPVHDPDKPEGEDRYKKVLRSAEITYIYPPYRRTVP